VKRAAETARLTGINSSYPAQDDFCSIGANVVSIETEGGGP
jgi:hypothetical protein